MGKARLVVVIQFYFCSKSKAETIESTGKCNLLTKLSVLFEKDFI